MNEQEAKLENIKNSCTTAIKITKIISVILTVITSILFVAGCILIGAQEVINRECAKIENLDEQLTSSFNGHFGVLSCDYEDIFINGNYGLGFGAICIGAAVVVFLTFIIVKAVRKVFEAILNSESPFSDEVLKTLKKTFIIVTIFVFMAEGFLPAAFFGLFFWSLYTIFQYGKVLQKQADETL